MKQIVFLLTTCFLLRFAASAQTPSPVDTLSAEDLTAVLSQIKIDSTSFLRAVANDACACIDSVSQTGTSKAKELEAIVACIDKEVVVYQGIVKLYTAMKSGGKNNKIEVDVDKNSSEYRQYYYDIERWLKDSCHAMNRALNTNDEAGEKSYSNNPEARKAYSKGVEYSSKEDFENAIPWFEKAVEIDPVFAFAWDNLGVSYRKTGKYEKAEAAYKESLKVDPKGQTALQNLPIAYLYQKKYQQAIDAYKDILKYYPDNPEVYYGIGNIYAVHMKEYEKGLENLCKAYTIYVGQKSPFRTDAEKLINYIYGQMKKENKEDVFYKILKDNNISSK